MLLRKKQCFVNDFHRFSYTYFAANDSFYSSMFSFLSTSTKILLLFCILAFLSGLYLDIHNLRLATKGIPLVILMFYAWKSPKRDLAMCAAFLFSFLGDITLELPDILPFALGLGLFLIAHLFFIRALFKRSPQRTLWPLLPISVYCGTIYYIMLPGLGPLLIPVAIYVLVIAMMMWRASIYTIHNKHVQPLFGALFFALSDSLIGINRFTAEFDGARYAIILTYWLAQFLLFHIILFPCATQQAQQNDTQSNHI